MTTELQWLSSKPKYETFALSLAADSEVYAGHLKKARELTMRAVDSALRVDSKENAAVWEENSAIYEAAFGNSKEAQQWAEGGLKIAPTNRGTEAEARLALAMAGNLPRAEPVKQYLDQHFPLSNDMQVYWGAGDRRAGGA